MNGGKEPGWRVLLTWGSVITFFGLPLVFFSLHVLSLETPWLHLENHLGQGTFSYLAGFYSANTALVAALAGLNSWDKRLANGNGKIIKADE